MYSYIARRLAFGALTVVGVSITVFVVMRILPGDPLVAIFGPEGMTKLIFDPQTERVLGVGIVGAGAGELIAEGVLAMEMGALAKDIALSIHPHPTLSETIMEAAEVFFGTSTDIYRPRKGGAG